LGLILLIPVQFVFGQAELPTDRRTPFLQIGAHFQAWRVQYEDYPVNQINAPISLFLPIGDRFQFQLSNTPAVSWVEQEQSITGPSDTWIQGSMIIGDNLGVINLGLGAPTGNTELDNNEFLISQYLSRNLFRFGLPVYGQGLTVRAGALFAKKLSAQVIFGAGGQYVKRGSYKPVNYEIAYTVDNRNYSQTFSPEYQQGDEISGQMGVDVLVNKNVKFMFDVMFTHYFRDLMDGEEVYGSGQKIVLKGSTYYRYNDKYLLAQILYRHKGKNEIRQGLGFIEEAYHLNGYQCEIDFYGQYAAVENAKLYALLDGRFYGKNEQGRNAASVIGGGIGIQYEATGGLIFDFRAKYMAGNLGDFLVEGIDFSMGVGFEL